VKTVATDATGTKRRVHFDMTQTQEVVNNEWSKEDCKRRWYTKAAIKQMKENALAANVASSRKKNNPCMAAFQKVYDECCEATSDDTSLSHFGEYALNVFAIKTLDHTGMERTFIRKVEHDKRRRKKELHKSVISNYSTYKNGSPRSRAELIRRSSETLTRPSRLLARHMAGALALSLQGS
jgi:hypothetical protein